MRSTRFELAALALTALHLLPAAAGTKNDGRSLTLAQLHVRSRLVFLGWPSPERPPAPCGPPLGYWQVHTVFRGDHALEQKIIPIYDYRPTGNDTSLVFEDGQLSFDATSSILFLGGTSECPMLVARGAQASENATHEVRALSSPSDCDAQLGLVEWVLRGLPTACKVDPDCKALALHPNSCERPRCVSAGAATALPRNWPQIAARARRACDSRWRGEPACAPLRIPVRCLERECVEGVSPSGMPAMTRGTLQESCAPFDAPSVELTIRPEGRDYPSISANVWGAGKPQRGGAGAMTLRYDQQSGEHDLAVSYCPFAQVCRPVRRLEIRLELLSSGKGEAEFDLETTDGDRLRGKVAVEFGPRGNVLCG